ncbi:MAG: EVE domain-containing protein [Parachlamydiaceae bacterium]|nr:EVE domain-containing protein [Parachlamydiaceae bacterium]
MARYWIGVASKEHVQNGVLGGFAQVCHGKAGPLNRMKGGDWIVYYSPTIKFGHKEPCQSFTAIGEITSRDAYSFAMSEDFIPWRPDVSFVTSEEVPIQTLLNELSFIIDKQKWGFPFRRGCFEITLDDFKIIAKAMGILL